MVTDIPLNQFNHKITIFFNQIEFFALFWVFSDINFAMSTNNNHF